MKVALMMLGTSPTGTSDESDEVAGQLSCHVRVSLGCRAAWLTLYIIIYIYELPIGLKVNVVHFCFAGRYFGCQANSNMFEAKPVSSQYLSTLYIYISKFLKVEESTFPCMQKCDCV